jgi:predicted nucleic acid-binding protein
MIYCDSSALTKLLKPEAASAELHSFLGDKSFLIGSELLRTELARAVGRYSPQHMLAVHAILERMDLIPVDGALLDSAGALLPASLRTLDAIHLASALLVRTELEAFVCYDRRLLDAASDLGLPVASPGME